MEEISFTFTSILKKVDSNVWAYSFLVPKNVSEQLIKAGSKRVVCCINKTEGYQCALMPFGNQEYYINVNKEQRKKLGIEVGFTIDVVLNKDTSEYGLPMPDEMLTAMELDADGTMFFKKLTLGKQRSLLHIVGKPKSSEIRIKKALVILQYLQEVQGHLDYKELNLAFKAANKK